MDEIFNGCYTYMVDGVEFMGLFSTTNQLTYKVCSLKLEHEDISGVALEDIPFLVLHAYDTRNLPIDHAKRGIYVVHYTYFRDRIMSFRLGYSDVFAIRFQMANEVGKPTAIDVNQFPQHLMDDTSPVIPRIMYESNLNELYELYLFRDSVANAFTKQLLKSEYLKDVRFDVSTSM